MAKRPSEPSVCRNRRATHRFEILEKIECGMVLTGTEVKSLRDGLASIEEAFAQVIDKQLWLIGSHIGAYRFGHTQSHAPLRRRKLLAHAREILKLETRMTQRGLTLVPLRIYFNDRGVAKLALGVARGKRRADKREDLKARDHQREMDRAMRTRR